MSIQLFIASDHAGFTLKMALLTHLNDHGYNIIDIGSEEAVSCDYPDSARLLCTKVLENSNSFGILVCGSGIGMSMAANRVRGVRASLATCEFHAKACREHNNANILCLGERVTGIGIAIEMVDVFLRTKFEGGRHLRRIELFD